MASPDVVEKLDYIDKGQVIFYRFGIMLAGISLFIPLSVYMGWLPPSVYLPVLACSCYLMASSVHIYNKAIRLIIVNATWVALILFLLNQQFSIDMPDGLIHGIFYITLSGVGYKESYCFKVWGLKFLPVLLLCAAVAELFQITQVAVILLAVSGFMVLLLSGSKWRMPVHFDIGDKSLYQI